MEGGLTDAAQGGVADIVLVPAPAGLVTVLSEVTLGAQLSTPGISDLQINIPYS